MRILFPCGLFYPSKLGGPANTIYWLAKALVKDGYEVSVVTSNNYIDDCQVERDRWTVIDKIRVIYCTAHRKLPLRIVRHSLKEIQSCDVVIFSSICYLPNFPIAIKAKLKRKKIIWSPRGELFEKTLQGNKSKLLYFKILKRILGKQVLFHATSNEERLSIQAVFGQNSEVTVIPNNMELPQMEERKDFTPQYLLYLGRIAPIKALDNLIEGLAMSERFMNSDFVFKFVGDVENQFKWYYKELQDLISRNKLEDKIVFVGHESGREKYKTCANAYFLFLVSNSENFGNVVIESLSQGTPVVASRGTPWQVLEKSNAGYWIQNSSKEIANCVNKVLSLSEYEYKMKREGAQALAKQYDVYENIKQWRQIIDVS